MVEPTYSFVTFRRNQGRGPLHGLSHRANFPAIPSRHYNGESRDVTRHAHAKGTAARKKENGGNVLGNAIRVLESTPCWIAANRATADAALKRKYFPVKKLSECATRLALLSE